MPQSATATVDYARRPCSLAAAADRAGPTTPRRLTDRQGDVLRLLCAGMTRRQAAACLGIRPNSLRQHLAEARARLGLGTPAELCARCPDDLAAADARAKRRAEKPQDETTAPE